MVDGSTPLWKTKRHQQWLEKLKEQGEVREMLNTYAPWGRPGCGAPDPEARERRSQLLQQLRLQGTRRLGDVGSPGGGGNGSGGGGNGCGGGNRLRGFGGCGAPIRTRSGKIVATRHPDPMLLFQPQAPLRKCVEERLRYQSSIETKMAYKKELDEMVQQRRKTEAEEHSRAHKLDRLLGWTGPADERMAQERKSPKEQRKTNDFGVELVPLLIQRRVPKKRHSRCITDVTCAGSFWDAAVAEKRARELQYLQELNQQVASNQQRMQEVRKEELASCLRHAERWQQIWSSGPRIPVVPRAARCLGAGVGCLLPRRRRGMGEALALG